MDNIPQLNRGPQVDLEKVRVAMHFRIAEALKHIMTPERFEQLLYPGSKKRKLASEEIIRSSAIAHNLTEFKILLEELGKALNKNFSGVLAHENAHMNVAEAEKVKVIGYAVTFLKGPEESIVSLAFGIMISPHLSSQDPRDQVVTMIRILNAPEEYGEILSPKDIHDITQLKGLLAQFETQEK
ncbi:hypothetical protein A2911_00745 [Candidatus Nomurabacteria bacterium RIFCSPLOWO2_01_FULL_40_15]|uniref:Uncharacterized protein n=1 Tax=Candidatus Nomurabacteria bacterium RIFCSPLOWO2_01_FULL_40_15 TaxID=1801772 RepID=A0A1F6X6T9_9BACT|nr:MAG: hypothetical protein A2911_00745 [Candidatus Nomurabacteria bacterium RIFCSPLOWO2_01_FULL_40_15]